jgi:hypothetical protein
VSRKTHALRGVEGLEDREVPATSGLAAPAPELTAALTATVARPSSQTVLLPSGVTLKYGESVTLTAVVLPTSAGPHPVTGTLTFKDGSTVLATLNLTNSQASFTTTRLPPGTHHITAVYSGGNYAASASPTKTLTVSGSGPVGRAGTVTSLTASLGSTTVGHSVTLTASVRATNGATPSGTVTFKDGSTVVGTATLSGGVARLAVSLRTAGTHNFTAYYGGASSYAASADTSPAVVSVHSTTPPPASRGTVTTLAGTPTVVTVGQAVTLTAVVRATVNGLAAPTGTVTFRDGTWAAPPSAAAWPD